MNIEKLHIFICAAECLNFTRAAKQLYISPSALSAQIADLEKSLGVDLFVRTTRSIALTPAGEYFLTEAKNLSKRFSEVKLRTREIDGGSIGTLNVGYVDTIGVDIIQRIMMDYHERFPKVEFVMRKMEYPDLVKSIGDMTIDAAFMVLNTDEFPPAVFSEPLLRARLNALLRTDHPLAQKSTVKLGELKDETLVLVHQRSNMLLNNTISQMFARQGCSPRKIIERQEPEDVAMTVACGMGIGIVSTFMSPCLSRFDDLCMVPLNHIMEKCDLMMVRHADNPNTCIDELFVVARDTARSIHEANPVYSLPEF